MQLLFYSSATGRYNEFVLPFITTALLSNPDSACEILTDQPARFVKAMDMLNELFGSRARILSIPARLFGWSAAPHLSSSIRFVTFPTEEAEYTYIGDIDIMTLEPVAQCHIDHMARTRMCYSNVIRPGTNRLTGLHFVNSKKWYHRISHQYMEVLTDWYEKSTLNSDEALLYRIARDYFGLPDPADDYRPVHGIHISPNRKIDGSPNWQVTTEKIIRLKKIMETYEWKAIFSYLDQSFLVYIDQILEYGKTLLK